MADTPIPRLSAVPRLSVTPTKPPKTSVIAIVGLVIAILAFVIACSAMGFYLSEWQVPSISNNVITTMHKSFRPLIDERENEKHIKSTHIGLEKFLKPK